MNLSEVTSPIPELKPCPICGGKPVCGLNATGELFEVRCSHFEQPPKNNGVSHCVIVTAWKRENVISEWNNR